MPDWMIIHPKKRLRRTAAATAGPISFAEPFKLFQDTFQFPVKTWSIFSMRSIRIISGSINLMSSLPFQAVVLRRSTSDDDTIEQRQACRQEQLRAFRLVEDRYEVHAASN